MGIMTKLLTGTGITIGTPIAAFVAVNMSDKQYNEALFDYSEVCEGKISSTGKDLSVITLDGKNDTPSIIPTEAELMTMAINDKIEFTLVEDELNCAIYNDVVSNIQKDLEGQENFNLDGMWVELSGSERKLNIGTNVASRFTYSGKDFNTIAAVNLYVKDLQLGTFKGGLESIDLGNLALPGNVVYTIANNAYGMNSDQELVDYINSGLKGIGEFTEGFKFSLTIPKRADGIYEINNQFTFTDYNMNYDKEADSVTLTLDEVRIKGESMFGDNIEVEQAKDGIKAGLDNLSGLDGTADNDITISEDGKTVILDKTEDATVIESMNDIKEALNNNSDVEQEDMTTVVEFYESLEGEEKEAWDKYFSKHFNNENQA